MDLPLTHIKSETKLALTGDRNRGNYLHPKSTNRYADNGFDVPVQRASLCKGHAKYDDARNSQRKPWVQQP
jgi:hypothetical protein